MNNDYTKYEEEIEELKKRMEKYTYVYIYGAGIYGRRLFKFLTQMGIKIEKIVVTSKENNPSQIGICKVITLEEVITNPEESLFIMGVRDSVEIEVRDILERKGFNNYINPPKKKQYYDITKCIPKLEITTKIGCGINCRYCPQKMFCTRYLQESEITVMSLELFKNCINKMPLNTVITFSGFCEPFLNEQCVEMIQYAALQGRKIELYTTLVGLSMEKLEKISQIDLKTVVLHTPDDKDYAKIPMTEEYFEVLDNVLDKVKKDGTPWIDSANCQGVPAPQFVEFAKGRIIVESNLCDRAGNLEEEQDLKRVERIEGKIKCSRMDELNQWVLLPDGRVTLCCMDFGLKHVLGNLNNQTYEEIRNGKELTKVKMGLNNLEIPILCRKCTAAMLDRRGI